MKIKAKEFDKKFDEGGDISKYLDVSKAKRPEQEQKRVNVDFPVWMIHLLDREARRLGSAPSVNHQSLGSRASCKGILKKLVLIYCIHTLLTCL